jgi:hypothetical protein
MKKLFYLFAVTVLAISLASCNKKDEPQPEPTPEVNSLVFDGYVDATYADYGYYEVVAITADTAWGIDLLAGVKSFNTTLTDDDFMEPTLYKLANDSVEAAYEITGIKLTASLNADQTIWTLNGTITANETEYTVKITAAMPEPADPHEYDEEASDFAEDFATYTLDDQYLEKYSYMAVEAENDNKATVMLGFYVPEGATSLVAGEYTVSDSQEAMTVEEGTFDASEGAVYASFAAYLDKDDYLDKVWYLVSGKVTVNEDGSIVLDAVNSKGKKITGTLTAPAPAEQGLEEGAPAKKMARKAIKGFPAKKHAF